MTDGNDADLRLLSEDEAAERMLLSPRTLAEHRRAGRGPRHFELPGGRIGYQIADLRVWLEQRAKTGTWFPRGRLAEIAA